MLGTMTDARGTLASLGEMTIKTYEKVANCDGYPEGNPQGALQRTMAGSPQGGDTSVESQMLKKEEAPCRA